MLRRFIVVSLLETEPAPPLGPDDETPSDGPSRPSPGRDRRTRHARPVVEHHMGNHHRTTPPGNPARGLRRRTGARLVVTVALAVLAALLAGATDAGHLQPAHADTTAGPTVGNIPRPQLAAPVAGTHRTAVLRGRTPYPHMWVIVQKRGASRHWVNVKVTTSRQRRFVFTVAPRRTTRYRVVVAGKVSRVRTVHRAGTTTPPPTNGTGTLDAGDSTDSTGTDSTGSTGSSGTGAPAPVDACGTRPAKPDGTWWSCTFVDDFAGTTLNRDKWVPQTDFATGSGSRIACHRDSPQNVAVAGGNLVLSLTDTGAAAPCATAAGVVMARYATGQVSTYHRFSQAYGRFEARFRNTATRTRGLHEAFWLWPDDRYGATGPWPTSGEIDVVETYSAYPEIGVPYLHYGPRGGGSVASGPDANTAHNCAAARGVWNTWTLEWSPTKIQIFVNGRPCLTNTSGDPAFAKRYIVLLTQALGSFDNEATDQTPVPAQMLVDYVRVWK